MKQLMAKIKSEGVLVAFTGLNDNFKGSFSLRKDFLVLSVFMNI